MDKSRDKMREEVKDLWVGYFSVAPGYEINEFEWGIIDEITDFITREIKQAKVEEGGKDMDNNKAQQATPENILEEQIMNPNIPKNEREHWASKKIQAQAEEIEGLKKKYGVYKTIPTVVELHLSSIRRLDEENKDLKGRLNKFKNMEFVKRIEKLKSKNKHLLDLQANQDKKIAELEEELRDYDANKDEELHHIMVSEGKHYEKFKQENKKLKALLDEDRLRNVIYDLFQTRRYSFDCEHKDYFTGLKDLVKSITGKES